MGGPRTQAQDLPLATLLRKTFTPLMCSGKTAFWQVLASSGKTEVACAAFPVRERICRPGTACLTDAWSSPLSGNPAKNRYS